MTATAAAGSSREVERQRHREREERADTEPEHDRPQPARVGRDSWTPRSPTICTAGRGRQVEATRSAAVGEPRQGEPGRDRHRLHDGEQGAGAALRPAVLDVGVRRARRTGRRSRRRSSRRRATRSMRSGCAAAASAAEHGHADASRDPRSTKPGGARDRSGDREDGERRTRQPPCRWASGHGERRGQGRAQLDAGRVDPGAERGPVREPSLHDRGHQRARRRRSRLRPET